MIVTSADIRSYIDFLIHQQGLFVSLHGKIGAFKDFFKYNLHMHPFCACVKLNNQDLCIQQQMKVIKHCTGEAFFGTCYAGMGEWIYPIHMREETVGFISVGGYCGNAEANSMTGGKNRFYTLLTPPPTKKTIDTLLRPLVNLCEVYYKENCDHLTIDTSFEKIIRYVNEYHTEEITIEKLSEKFNYSISSISHKFKKNTGMSLRKYIEQLRIHHAKRLLTQSNLNITEIAMLTGFCNSGYLSMIFKKNIGVTPSQYRKNNTL